MKNILLVLFILISSVCNAQVSKLQSEQIIKKEFITIGYDTKRNIPNWVFEKQLPFYIEGPAKRIANFYKDEEITNCISESIYSKSGYDKGHMAPAADFKFYDKAMYESFTIANIAPQLPKFNRQYWESLEEYTRKITAVADTTYIITGHIPGFYIDVIKDKVYVPIKFFKAIYAVKAGKCICSVAYIMVNKEEQQDYRQCKYSIDYLEKRLNRDLFIGISKESYERRIILPQFR